MALKDPVALWLGLLWFRLSAAVYFGFGSMVHIFFNDESTKQAQSYFYVLPEHLFKLNLIVILCVICVLVTARVLASIFKQSAEPVVTEDGDRLLFICCVAFGILGYGFKYMIYIPYAFGFFGNVVIPAIFIQIALLAPVSLFLLTLWSIRHAQRFLGLAVLLLCMDLLTGCLLLAKAEVLKPLIVFLLAFLQHKTTRIRLAAAAVAVLLCFQTLVPMAVAGRSAILLRTGALGEGDFNIRSEIISDYFLGNLSAENYAESQSGLMRIAYASASVPAIVMYDHGRPGTSIERAPIILYPRMLWPDKPILDSGVRYNILVNGQAGSASWMGLFAEAYWNFGWPGIPLLMVPLGAAFFIIGRMSIQIMKNRKWLHFVIVLLGMYMGIRTDGLLVDEMLVTLIMVSVFYVAATVAEGLLKPLLQGRQRPAFPR